MAKQKCTVSEDQIELNHLIVKKAIEKTNNYDKIISQLQRKMDYFNWGIKQIITNK